MNTKLCFYLCLILTTCSIGRNDGEILIKNIQSNHFLRTYIRKSQIKGHIGSNFYQKTASDSLVFLEVNLPIEQSYPIDSIYFFYFSKNNYKILAQSEFEKGLIYIECDKNGNHKKLFSFGGYVVKVSDLEVNESKNNLELKFKYDVWGSTTPKPETVQCKIKSTKGNINFEAFVKESSGEWASERLD